MALKDDITTPNVPGISLPDTQLKTPAVKNPIEIIPKHADVNPFAADNKGFYSTMYGQLFGDNAPETPEEKSKREKRERVRSVIAALGDGLSSIANIWGATQGATPMNLDSLSEANRRRYEYADNLRKQNEDKWKHGILQARIGDMNLRRQDAAVKAQAARWKQEQEYKIKKDTRDFLAKQAEAADKKMQQLFDNNLAVEKLAEQKRTNKVRESIGWANANTAKERADKAPKMAQFSVGNGNTVNVPDENKYMFAADVYRKLVEASGGSQSPVLNFYKTEIEGSVPNTSAMMNAINYYIQDFPEVQQYMYRQAQKYRTSIPNVVRGTPTPKTTSTPGSPTNANVPISQEVFEYWSDFEIE